MNYSCFPGRYTHTHTCAHGHMHTHGSSSGFRRLHGSLSPVPSAARQCRAVSSAHGHQHRLKTRGHVHGAPGAKQQIPPAPAARGAAGEGPTRRAWSSLRLLVGEEPDVVRAPRRPAFQSQCEDAEGAGRTTWLVRPVAKLVGN